MIYLLPKYTLRNFLQLSAQKKHLIAVEASKKTEENIYTDALSGIQKSIQTEKKGVPSVAIFQLLKLVETAVHLGEANELDWLLINQISEVTRELRSCVPLNDKHAWLGALECAAIAINNNDYRPKLNYGSREALVAGQLLGLKNEGIKYNLNLQSGYLPDNELSKLCSKIEKKIITVGGEQSANLLLHLLQRSGRVLDGSLMHARVTSSWQSKQRVGTPWHFIYSLCLKHIDKPQKSKNIEQDLEKMERMAMGMAASFDIETHSSFEHTSIDVHSSLYIIQETLVYDELWAFPQWQPHAAMFLITNWIDALVKEKIALPIYSQEVWTEVAGKIYFLSQNTSLTRFHPWQFYSENISYDQAEEIANWLSLNIRERNRKYLTPRDTKERKSTFHPLIEMKDGLCLQPRSIAVRAFCERLYTLIREGKDKSLENKMGKAFERLAISVLEKFGCNVSFKNAKYKFSKHDTLEIDMVVETEERIFLIECKKKALKASSRTGIFISQLEDLNGSFLKMLDQLSKHEKTLRERGEIKFKDGRTLALNGRKIEKIALSMFDHGSIQDRFLLQNLFLAIMQGKFIATKTANEKIVCQANTLVSSIRSSLEVIHSLQHDYNNDFWREYIMSTWWLSIDQLYYMCHRKNDLWEGMKKVRHATRGSRDFVYELMAADKMSNELLEQVGKMNSVIIG